MKFVLLIAATFLLTDAYAQNAVLGLKSAKDTGTVSIQAAPTLSDGRLVLKVVAFNASTRPAALAAENIRV
jgi:hypothetical protein